MDFHTLKSMSAETRESFFQGAGIVLRGQYNAWLRRGLRRQSDEAQIKKLANCETKTQEKES
jgi:hypothetical protein